MNYDVLIAGAAASIMSREDLTTDNLDPLLIRQHLISKGVQL